LLVHAHLAVGLNKSGWKVGALQAARGRSGLASEGEQGVPCDSRARYGIWIVRLEGEQRLDVCFGLSRGGVEVEAHDMEHAQERPQVFGGDGCSFQCAHDLAELGTLMDGLLRYKAVQREPPLKLFAICRAPGTVEQPDEILEEYARTAQRDEDKAIVLRIERVGLLEIF